MGKTHGAIPRSGKVKWYQTVKWAKKDKKKNPRGRAYKRMVYNRRILNAVIHLGKKMGPNYSSKK